MGLSNTVANHIQQLKILNCLQGLEITENSKVVISDSNITACGDSSVISGAGIYVHTKSNNIAVLNSTFSENIAQNGAAIDVSHSMYSFLHLIGTKYISKSMLQNNIFIKNTASESGGGIRFNLYPPELSNNIFTNNTAQYGQNIASYVVKAISLNHTGDQIKLENVGSGQSLSTPLYLAIVDNEGKNYGFG